MGLSWGKVLVAWAVVHFIFMLVPSGVGFDIGVNESESIAQEYVRLNTSGETINESNTALNSTGIGVQTGTGYTSGTFVSAPNPISWFIGRNSLMAKMFSYVYAPYNFLIKMGAPFAVVLLFGVTEIMMFALALIGWIRGMET